jgi:formiminotetrahydrofolate cyclodeaminase
VDKSYSEFALVDLLDAFASGEPVPGGGSAAALAGATGVSLLLMATGLPKTRSGTPEEAADLSAAAARLRPLRDRLSALVDEDSAAYRKVMAALRLPKATEAEKAARRDALEAAMRAATETPLDTLRACQQALRGAVAVARNASRAAASDVGVAIELLTAAARSAALNVDTNLGGLHDAAFAARTREERRELEEESLADARQARTLL